MDQAQLRQQLEGLHSDSFGWALSCCAGRRDDAEEVLQTSYLKVLSGKARFGGRSAFKTWLFSVIRLTAADQRRRYAIRWTGLGRLRDATDHAPPPRPAEPTEAVEQQQRRDQLRAALAELPKRQREVIQLVFYHDNSLREAAEIMGVSLGSARTHYHRGKRHLRAWLQEHDVEI